jgi:hypothetical protein
MQVGYDNVQQYWLAKNSYGSTWGDGGLFKVPTSNSNMHSCHCSCASQPMLCNTLSEAGNSILTTGVFCMLTH